MLCACCSFCLLSASCTARGRLMQDSHPCLQQARTASIDHLNGLKVPQEVQNHIAAHSMYYTKRQPEKMHVSRRTTQQAYLACLRVFLAVSHECVNLANIVLHELNHERHCQVCQTILPCNLHIQTCECADKSNTLDAVHRDSGIRLLKCHFVV